MWWDDAVIYQIYPRSFQDTDGDGIGDLQGIISRLDHVASLGADAIWLSPIYVSPNADFGYDVADYTSVDPTYGSLDDLDQLIDAAHTCELKVLLDFVPCHTSTAHPWFRERPDFYVWADQPPNNWLASFGGSAWSRDARTGRYYLHSFYPEQADLNWRNPEVREEMANALRFWCKRGVDGFRLDALDRLLKDPALRDDPVATGHPVFPLHAEYGGLHHIHSSNAPDIGVALEAIRAAVGERILVGEIFLPTADLGPYLDALDVVFAFEAMFAAGDPDRLATSIESACQTRKLGWVLSNHDFERFASRFGENTRAATLLFMALPGPLFMFQGDEIGMRDGPGVKPPLDRADRDRYRHPMQWDSSPNGGFTRGTPWLPLVDQRKRNVAAQRAEPDSLLSLCQRLIEVRRQLSGEVRIRESPPQTIVLERGDHVVAVNLGTQPAEIELPRKVIAEARQGDGGDPKALPPHGGVIVV